MSSSLSSSEAAADVFYNFPAGLLEALGMSESSNGANTGSLGNVFQVTPSTAADPGYGLSGVNGNSAMSVGAFLSALIQKAGSVAGGVDLYQDWAANGGSPNASMSSYLNSIGQGSIVSSLTTGLTNTAVGTVQAVTNPLGWLTDQITGTPATSSTSSGSGNFTGIALQIAVVLLAILFIVIGIAALALKSDPVQAATKIAGTVVK